MFVAILTLGILYYALFPKPQSQPSVPFQNVETPIADEGKEIPVLFGTKDLKGPNVVWYGDVKAVPNMKSGGKK